MEMKRYISPAASGPGRLSGRLGCGGEPLRLAGRPTVCDIEPHKWHNTGMTGSVPVRRGKFAKMCSIIQRCRQACLLVCSASSTRQFKMWHAACRITPHHGWLQPLLIPLAAQLLFLAALQRGLRWLTCCRRLTRVPLSSFPNRPCWRRMRGSCLQKQRATAEIGSCRDLFTGPELPRLAVSPRPFEQIPAGGGTGRTLRATMRLQRRASGTTTVQHHPRDGA